MLLEAVTTGVMRSSAIATHAPKQEWIKVLRPALPLPSNSQGKRVADYAEAIYGRGYSYRGAFASRFPVIGAAEPGRVFCSQVVAQAFADYGAPLFPDKKPCEIFPGLLAVSPNLVDVTFDCVRAVNSETDAELYQQIRATAEQSSPSEEMLMNRRAFDAIKSELGQTLPRDVHSLPDLFTWLSANSALPEASRADETIHDLLEREGMFKWSDEFSAQVQALAGILELCASGAEASVNDEMTEEIRLVLDDLRETIPLGDSSLAGREVTKNENAELAKITGLKTFKRMSDVYRRLYEDSKRVHDARVRVIRALEQRSP